MSRFKEFIRWQWHIVEGNAKWWFILVAGSISVAIFKLMNHDTIMRIIGDIGVILVFWSLVIYLWFRAWCRREDALKKSDDKTIGDRLVAEKQQEWLKNKKFKGPKQFMD